MPHSMSRRNLILARAKWDLAVMSCPIRVAPHPMRFGGSSCIPARPPITGHHARQLHFHGGRSVVFFLQVPALHESLTPLYLGEATG